VKAFIAGVIVGIVLVPLGAYFSRTKAKSPRVRTLAFPRWQHGMVGFVCGDFRGVLEG